MSDDDDEEDDDDDFCSFFGGCMAFFNGMININARVLVAARGGACMHAYMQSYFVSARVSPDAQISGNSYIQCCAVITAFSKKNIHNNTL